MSSSERRNSHQRLHKMLGLWDSVENNLAVPGGFATYCPQHVAPWQLERKVFSQDVTSLILIYPVLLSNRAGKGKHTTEADHAFLLIFLVSWPLCDESRGWGHREVKTVTTQPPKEETLSEWREDRERGKRKQNSGTEEFKVLIQLTWKRKLVYLICFRLPCVQWPRSSKTCQFRPTTVALWG